MAVTERQRHVVADVKASVGYFKAHENTEKMKLSNVLLRAGIENQGSFYSVVNSLKHKWDRDPEAKQLLREVKESLASVGIHPVYLDDVRTYTRKAASGDTLELEQETLVELETPKSSKKTVLQIAPQVKETPSEQRTQPMLGGLQDITERFDPANEVHALNLTIFALQGLPQLKRENVMQAVAGLFGMGNGY